MLENLAAGAGRKGEALPLALTGKGVFHSQFRFGTTAGEGSGVPYRQLQRNGRPFSGAVGAGLGRGVGVFLAARGQGDSDPQHPRQGQQQGYHRKHQGEHKYIQGQIAVEADKKGAGAQQHQQIAQPVFPHGTASFPYTTLGWGTDSRASASRAWASLPLRRAWGSGTTRCSNTL